MVEKHSEGGSPFKEAWMESALDPNPRTTATGRSGSLSKGHPSTPGQKKGWI